MKNVVVKITPPVERTDGSAASAADISAVRIYRGIGSAEPVVIAEIPLPASLTFKDLDVAPGVYTYGVSLLDKQTPPVESALSNEVTVTIAEDKAALKAPSITVNVEVA